MGGLNKQLEQVWGVYDMYTILKNSGTLKIILVIIEASFQCSARSKS